MFYMDVSLGRYISMILSAPIYIRNKVALKTSERAAGMKFN